MRKKLCGLGACLIGSLVLISFVGGTVSYGIFFFLLGIPVVCYAYLLLAVLQFRIYQSVATREVTAGSLTPYQFTIENAGWVSISSIRVRMFSNFSYVEKLPDETDFELLPGEQFHFETNLTCLYRGAYPVGVQSLVLTDFLGLFHINYRIPNTLEAIVNPRIPLAEEYDREEEEPNRQRENILLKQEPDVVVHPYTEADSLRNIHWNATAAMGSLQARGLTGEEDDKVAIFFDTTRCSKTPEEFLPVENRILETVLLYVEHDIAMGQPVGVFYKQEAVECFFIEKLADFERFYEAIKRVDFDLHRTQPEAEELQDEIAKYGRFKRVEYVTSPGREGLYES